MGVSGDCRKDEELLCKMSQYLSWIENQVRWQETRLEDSMQASLIAPFPEPENRKCFWSDFKNRNFDYIASKYSGTGIKYKIRRILGKV